ncbi:MAG: hypothetical protein KA190_18030 [Kofleriaceae bacterium]|nr:hypothetical protein [Kofleriaceae bacterium]
MTTHDPDRLDLTAWQPPAPAPLDVAALVARAAETPAVASALEPGAASATARAPRRLLALAFALGAVAAAIATWLIVRGGAGSDGTTSTPTENVGAITPPPAAAAGPTPTPQNSEDDRGTGAAPPAPVHRAPATASDQLPSVDDATNPLAAACRASQGARATTLWKRRPDLRAAARTSCIGVVDAALDDAPSCDLPAELHDAAARAFDDGDYHTATVLYERALRCSRGDTSVPERLLLSACRAEDRARARRYWRRFPKLQRPLAQACAGVVDAASAPTKPDCSRADALDRAGKEAFASGQYAEASSIYQQVLLCRPADPTIQKRALLIACRAKDRPTAQRLWAKYPAIRAQLLQTCTGVVDP